MRKPDAISPHVEMTKKQHSFLIVVVMSIEERYHIIKLNIRKPNVIPPQTKKTKKVKTIPNKEFHIKPNKFLAYFYICLRLLKTQYNDKEFC